MPLAAYLAFVFILIIVLYYRYQVLLQYSFLYTDSDQNIMWGALNDFAHGIFKEPRFYGQNYNTFLEAFLAVPLYQLGYQAYTALPFVTMCLTLFPFVYLSFLSLQKRSLFYALVILSLPLAMPFEYGIISSMPRGFVTAFPFAAIACTAIFYEAEKRFFFLAGFMSVLAFSFNSNAALIIVPLLFYLWLQNIQLKRFYFKTGAGLLLGALLHWLSLQFYVQHPFYNIHHISLNFTFENLIKGLSNLNYFLNFNAPYFWQHGGLVLVTMLLYALFFVRQKNKNAALTVIAMLLFLLFSFGLNKIYDGTDSLHFHSARMYLALPLLLTFCFILVKPRYEPNMLYFFLLIPMHYYQVQCASLEKKISDLTAQRTKEVVIVSQVKPILNDCRRINAIAQTYKVNLFVVANHFYADAYASGCKACFDDFPNTLNTKFERRTWRLLEDENKIYKNVMIIDMDQKLDTSLSFLKKIPGTIDLYLVKNNSLKTMQLLDSLHIQVRRFR